ncbi:twin-arginine translocase subunit TatC [Bacillaceae bacterium S4-13-58]
MSKEQDSTYQDKEMNLLDHLDELRNRLIWTAVVFLVFLVLGFVFVTDIYNFFIRNLEFQLTVIGPGEIIWTYFMLASVVALAGTLPFLLLQVWLYVRPALTKKERKATLNYIPAVFLLFLGGLSFGFFVVHDLILNFLMSLGDEMFQTMFTAEKYFRFLLGVTLPIAILFEIPIVMMFLTSLGIVDPFKLRKFRKYAYLILVIVGATISPPDFFLQIVIAIPLFILYEVSILLSSRVYKRKKAKEKEWEEEMNKPS